MSFDLSGLGDWAALPFFTDKLPEITKALAAETRPVFPPAEQVFAALAHTQPDDVKVVIFGQDPYPQPAKAHGFAFSIPNDFPPRKHRDSLDNIFEELHADLGITRKGTNLADWADKGVLLFNCLALTVPENVAGGHRTLGWKILTQQVLTRLSNRPRAYLLWGGDAHKAGSEIDRNRNHVIKTSHPSPMGVHKSGVGYEAFRGARPFSRTNAWLQAQGSPGIYWDNP